MREHPVPSERLIAENSVDFPIRSEQLTGADDAVALTAPMFPDQARTVLQSRTNAPWYFPRTAGQLLERHQHVLDLFRTGALSDEVQQLGVKAQWLAHYHAQKPFVAIAEQNIPVSSIFHHLGEYGAPAVLEKSCNLLAFLRAKLKQIHNREVDAGLLVSPEDQVTFAGVTNGFFFPVPSLGQLTELASRGSATDARMENLQLISKSQRSKLESNSQGGIAYRFVELDVTKVQEVLTWADKAQNAITPSLKKHEKSLAKQSEFYDEHSPTFSTEECKKLRDQIAATSERINTCRQILSSLEIFRADVLTALESARANPSDTKLSFWKLIRNFNDSFCQRLELEFPFKTISNDLVNEFPSQGVENWGRLLGAFVRNNVIEPKQCALRWRNDIEGQPSRYVSLSISTITQDDVILQDRIGNSYSARELQIASLQSLEANTGPRLIPGASIIYWVNYAIGNSIVLDDGMYYKKIERLARAVNSAEFCKNPREIVIYPYTKLYSYCPPDANDPYSEIKPSYSTLDYYKSLSGQHK